MNKKRLLILSFSDARRTSRVYREAYYLRHDYQVTHAGLADNYMQQLPSFEQASVNELLDIKKSLNSCKSSC